MVEVSAKFMDKKHPFGMTDRFLITVGFDTDCEAFTFLGVEPHALLDLGLVVVDESGDVARRGKTKACEYPTWSSYPRRASTW